MMRAAVLLSAALASTAGLTVRVNPDRVKLGDEGSQSVFDLLGREERFCILDNSSRALRLSII